MISETIYGKLSTRVSGTAYLLTYCGHVTSGDIWRLVGLSTWRHAGLVPFLSHLLQRRH